MGVICASSAPLALQIFVGRRRFVATIQPRHRHVIVVILIVEAVRGCYGRGQRGKVGFVPT